MQFSYYFGEQKFSFSVLFSFYCLLLLNHIVISYENVLESLFGTFTLSFVSGHGYLSCMAVIE